METAGTEGGELKEGGGTGESEGEALVEKIVLSLVARENGGGGGY